MTRWNVQQPVTCVRSFGDIAWPARSPDLTVPGVMTIQELKQAIVDEVTAIDGDLRRRSVRQLADTLATMH